jgi:hypothetical protein
MRSAVSSLLFVFLLIACTPGMDPSEVQHRIQSLFELPTVEMVFRDVIYHKSHQQVFGVVNYDFRETLFRVSIRIQAGFDLSSPKFAVVRDQQRVTIKLPPPTILLVDADDESLYEYFARDNSIGWQNLQNAKKKQLEQAQIRAVQLGILNEAKRNARLRLAELMNTLSIQDWDLEIAENKENDHP